MPEDLANMPLDPAANPAPVAGQGLDIQPAMDNGLQNDINMVSGGSEGSSMFGNAINAIFMWDIFKKWKMRKAAKAAKNAQQILMADKDLATTLNTNRGFLLQLVEKLKAMWGNAVVGPLTHLKNWIVALGQKHAFLGKIIAFISKIVNGIVSLVQPILTKVMAVLGPKLAAITATVAGWGAGMWIAVAIISAVAVIGVFKLLDWIRSRGAQPQAQESEMMMPLVLMTEEEFSSIREDAETTPGFVENMMERAMDKAAQAKQILDSTGGYNPQTPINPQDQNAVLRSAAGNMYSVFTSALATSVLAMYIMDRQQSAQPQQPQQPAMAAPAAQPVAQPAPPAVAGGMAPAPAAPVV